MSDIRVTLPPDAIPGEYIFRQGAAEIINEPVPVILSGIITAPGDFLDTRKKVITTEDDKKNVVSTNRCHVIANYKDKTIKFVVNENSKYATVVTGKLEFLPELKTLGINEEKFYDKNKLYSAMRFLGPWFKNKDLHVKFLEKLKKFEGDIAVEFKNQNDHKGKVNLSRVYEIKTNLNLTFQLMMPVFAGGVSKLFTVDINLDLRDSDVVFWLESTDLHEALTAETTSLFEKELKRFAGIAIIKTW